jgi:hypothetical protein
MQEIQNRSSLDLRTGLSEPRQGRQLLTHAYLLSGQDRDGEDREQTNKVGAVIHCTAAERQFVERPCASLVCVQGWTSIAVSATIGKWS